VQLDEGRRGTWQLQLLAPEIDAYWRTINYQQVEDAVTWTEFAPPLTQEQLREGLTNQFDFNQEQLALLERRILEGTGKISFRLNGPRTGYNNLFAWDSGYGPASAGAAPELFLNLGPSPQETPPPHYVVITSTPTPENVLTAAAEAVRLTAEATRIGTATPLPPNWVTPFVVTATPTPENEATAQAMSQEATAIALVTGLPPNVATATPTPTITPAPTYVVITSTPTPENVLTAAAEATRIGTVTPLPANWATPIVVTSTPTPENEATSQARDLLATAVALTTGTATVIPGNMQTATATPAFIWIEPIVSPTPTLTPSPTPQLIPTVLLGKIIFLSHREEGITETDSPQAELSQSPPRAYAFDPETGQLGRLTNIWPYEVAAIRDAWSSDAVYEAYNKQLLWTSIEDERGNRTPTEVFAIHYYDHLYKVEHQVTHLGAGWAWDPAWSPVGNQIAFVSNDSADNEIWVINHDGSHQMQLTSSNEAYNAREIGKDTFVPEVNGHPTWSPDGQQIVFYSNRTGNNQLWIMNKDGSEQRLLMDWNPYNDWDPVWIKYLDSAPPLAREPDWRFLKPPEESQVVDDK
jgi:hypothetical protein